MRERIQNCYDSHTHFWATGQVAEGLQLQNLKSANDVAKLAILPQHYRAHWLVGFGWNQNNWPDKKFPTKEVLDLYFPDTPVFFSRVDGHASWLNSAAIKELIAKGYNFFEAPAGGVIEKDSAGQLTGVLFDQAHIQAMLMLPEYTYAQNKLFFQSAQSIFNRAGFTHIRDMSMHLGSWAILREMEKQNELNLCVDALVTVETLAHLECVLNDLQIMKSEGSQQMRLQGVKIFIDGSLGSKTAFLSESYQNSNERGLLIWNFNDIKELILRTWKHNYHVAIHCIGDEAAHIAVSAAREVAAAGLLGRLHLEHLQILRQETIQLMKPLHLNCYFQPCHWLSDQSWLNSVLPQSLQDKVFQWELLRKNKIPFYFGSDSPIEKPSLFDNQKALALSAEKGIPMLNADWKIYHQHSDLHWYPSYTEFEDGEIKEVVFNGKKLI